MLLNASCSSLTTSRLWYFNCMESKFKLQSKKVCISLAKLLECLEFLYLNNGDRQLWSKLLYIKKSSAWENVKDIVEQHFGSTSNHNQLRLGPLLNLQVIKTFHWPQNKQPNKQTNRKLTTIVKVITVQLYFWREEGGHLFTPKS